MRLLALALLLISGSAYAGNLDHDRPLAGQTSAFGMPTGELVPRGEFQLQETEFSLLGVSAGLGEHFDLSFSAPILPIFGAAQVRFGLFNHNFPVQLAVGVGASFGMMDDNPWIGELFSGAVAIKTGRFNLRLSSTATRLGEPLKAVQLMDAGVSFAPFSHLAFSMDLLYLRWIERVSPFTYRGHTVALDSGGAVLTGIKIIGGTFSADLGMLVPLAGGGAMIPMVNFIQRI